MEFQDVPVDENRARQMNPIVLAFVGDAVQTLYVRQSLALSSRSKTGELNRRASEVVSAHGQSGQAARVLPRLTEEEAYIYRRGRNAKKPTKSKHATALEYSSATALETLIGYLYLTGREKRIKELLFFGDETEEET